MRDPVSASYCDPRALCPACDYDLSGVPAASPAAEHRRCSECGQALTAAAIAVARERSFFRRLRTRLLIVILIVPFAAVAALVASGESAVYVAPLLVLLVAPLAPVVLAAYCGQRIPDD